MRPGANQQPANAISGFKATGIYPFNPDAIPDYAFVNSDNNMSTNTNPSISPLLNDPLGNKCNENEISTTNSTVIYDIQNIDIVDIVDSQLNIANISDLSLNIVDHV